MEYLILISKDTIPSEYQHLIQPNTKYKIVSNEFEKDEIEQVLIRINNDDGNYSYIHFFPRYIFLSEKELRQIKLKKIL